jgi:predicted Zn-dependent protease with MMP-like domain
MPKRRRGLSAADLAAVRRRDAAGRRGHARFEELVERALAAVPEPFASHLATVAVVIEDEPSPAVRRAEGLRPDETLYGYYEGTPRTAWAADEVPLPNKITIYRLPLEEDFADPVELEDEVRLTVIHEIAHHLGIDDDRLDELGLG